ncbi:MAG: hypothetical protein A3D92_25305 [Bacteroidetes bacterium RIFCSPHIGHO2_02_FULL_44_7]|nr:MAG: hypothetical protein A3D92_25305 [Bacteroidetes bacterium RIFCSPHIGHO2_02_FULL_44_7]
MKKLLFTLALISAAGSITHAQRMPPPEDQRKVQVAILFDTSGSMDGLIDQAKSRIWNIILEISRLQYNGQQPTLEIALYQYGNDGLAASDNYIEQVLDLSSDLDVLSQKLFALHTNGGSEYCGAVIGRSLDDLKWSDHPNDLRMIYIAGNEPFNQGPVDFHIECKKAAGRDVFINTIYCGDYQQGIREGWQDGSLCTQGDYFNINSNEKIVQIVTPYDDMITKYNDSLNSTYYGYGELGMRRNSAQKEEDMNAATQSPSAAAERTIVKSKKGSYSNESWDLVDGVAKGEVDILELEESELPEEFRGKTEAEKIALLDEKTKEREIYQAKIGQLAIDREAYIQAELKKRAEAGDEVDDFGTSVNKSINEKAEKIGFVKEAHN